MPPLSIPSPIVVHHMGALDGQSAPPNSLEAVRASLQAGAEFIEIDVNALAVDDYLLVHDADLSSETSGAGPVAGTTPAQARELWIKHRGKVTNCRVPLLSDVVKLFLENPGSSRLQLDFKNVFPLPTDEPLERLVRMIEPLKERVLLSSGADWQLRRLRRLAPWLMLGFDIMFYIYWRPASEHPSPGEPPQHLGAYGYYDDHILAGQALWTKAEYLRDRCETFMSLVPDVSVFYLEHNLINQSLQDGFNWAATLHEHGIKLDAWTMDVTNPLAVEHAPRLREAGVDLFTSNTPRALAALLGIGK
jgi:glycerophosphoryl diester phosphodiesterase